MIWRVKDLTVWEDEVLSTGMVGWRKGGAKDEVMCLQKASRGSDPVHGNHLESLI